MIKKRKVKTRAAALLLSLAFLIVSGITASADDYEYYITTDDDNGYYDDYAYDDTYGDYSYDDGYDDYSYDDYSYDDYSYDDYSDDDYSDDESYDDDYSYDDYSDYSDEESDTGSDESDSYTQSDDEDDENANSAVVIAETPVPEYTPNPNIMVPGQEGSYYVLDNASALNEETEREIDELGSELYKETGAQVVLVTIATTRYSLKDYAYTLFNQWKIGGDGQYGLLFLLDIEDDSYYSYAGEGLKTEINSSDLSQLNKTYLEPYFAQKDYDNAALAVYKGAISKAEAAMELIGPVGTPDPALSESSQAADAEETNSDSGEVKDRAVSVFSGLLKIVGTAIAVLLGVCLLALIFIYLHGRKVKKQRKEARKHKNRNRAQGSANGRRTSRR